MFTALYDIGDILKLQCKGKVEHNRIGEITAIKRYYQQMNFPNSPNVDETLYEEEVFHTYGEALDIERSGNALLVRNRSGLIDTYILKRIEYEIELRTAFPLKDYNPERYRFSFPLPSDVTMKLIGNRKDNGDKVFASWKHKLSFFFHILSLKVKGDYFQVFHILPLETTMEWEIESMKNLCKFRDKYNLQKEQVVKQYHGVEVDSSDAQSSVKLNDEFFDQLLNLSNQYGKFFKYLDEKDK